MPMVQWGVGRLWDISVSHKAAVTNSTLDYVNIEISSYFPNSCLDNPQLSLMQILPKANALKTEILCR
jgi:hypothetical protein